MQIMYVYVIQILGKSFGKMYLQCITEKYKVIGKEMVFFRELVHGYEFFINRTHTILQGFDFSRVQVLQVCMTSPDTGWGNKLWEQFFVQRSVCTPIGLELRNMNAIIYSF